MRHYVFHHDHPLPRAVKSRRCSIPISSFFSELFGWLWVLEYQRRNGGRGLTIYIYIGFLGGLRLFVSIDHFKIAGYACIALFKDSLMIKRSYMYVPLAADFLATQ